MSLYQTIRPTRLEEIVGNSATIGALVKMLRKPANEQPHAILLKGPSGCGKTTIARILATAFGSTNDSIFELNGANTRGIETVRQITSTSAFRGLGGATKTYIFDESHQLTKEAQEGMLKLLEDNPPYCYFILCTTNPENIIKTIRNRCAEYEVSLLTNKEIKEVLKRACDSQKLFIHQDIIEAVILTCEGSPRAALVALEQVSNVTNVEEALEVLVRGTEKDANTLDLLKLLIMAPEQRGKRWKQIIEKFSLIDEEPEKVRRAILTFLFNKLKKQSDEKDARDIVHLLEIFSVSVYYGGKAQLGGLVARSCFETWKDEKERG
jgi:DNA polymerase III gamma/tau subunit